MHTCGIHTAYTEREILNIFVYGFLSSYIYAWGGRKERRKAMTTMTSRHTYIVRCEYREKCEVTFTHGKFLRTKENWHKIEILFTFSCLSLNIFIMNVSFLLRHFISLRLFIFFCMRRNNKKKINEKKRRRIFISSI